MGQIISDDFNGFESKKVTILMAAYNADKHLEETLESISNQSYEDFNLLVVDDGSNDNTLKILEAYDDPRLYILINEKNEHLVASLNRGLEVVKSEYIMRMDADDIMVPERIEKQISYMDANPAIDICGTYLKYFGKRDEVIKLPTEDDEIKANLPFHSIMPHATVVYRKKHLDQHKIRYSPQYIHMEDIDLWSRIFSFTRFAIIPETLYLYRWDGQNITDKNAHTRRNREEQFYKDLYERLEIRLPENLLSAYLDYRNKLKLERKDVKRVMKFLNEIVTWNRNKELINHKFLVQKVYSERKRLFFISIDQSVRNVFVFWRHPDLVLRNMRYVLSRIFKKKNA
jgi:glycosyltransferase involved in cell wall biosynthesis